MIEPKVYVVVPHTVQLKDGTSITIPCGWAMAQVSHAAAQLQHALPDIALQHFITAILECKDSKELAQVERLASSNGFSHVLYWEEHRSLFPAEQVNTAVAILDMHRTNEPFRYLKPWRCET